MSVSLYRWTEACEGVPCPGDCDLCSREDEEEMKIIKDEFDGLKPCPFCGSTKVTLIRPVSLTGEFVFAVNCVNCETGINHNGIEFYKSWREAVNAWNRRERE